MKIIIEIPKVCAEALAVAISNHAHSFAISIETTKHAGDGSLRKMDAEDKRTLLAWQRNRDALLSAKDQVKHQAGIK